MEKRTLQFGIMVKTVMIVLFLWMVGMTKVNGFPIICPNGQTLYFRITDAANYHVEVTYPNHHEDDGYWEDYELLPGDVIIPETIEYGGNTYTVTSIGNHAFCQCDSFNGSLSIPNTVTTIGNMAFYECGQWLCGLYGPLIIPNSVLSIGDEAFVRCNKITGDLIIPNSVTHIGNSAFGQCSGIEHISIPNSVSYIGNGAFRYCTSIDYIDIPNSITTINASTFQGCSNLTSVIISNSVTSIEENAFKDCTSLTEIVIPSSVNSIKKNSFMNTGWYNEQDDGILYLGQFCIGYKGNEPEGGLSIIDDILYVCDEAFKDCSELTTISFPNSLIKIGSHAFSNCYGINGSLTIPDNVTVIGDYAFKNCNGFSGNLTIGNSVTSIGNFAFYNCNGFTGPLTISNSVISIGNCAFYNCNMFSGSLTIGNSVSTIGYSAFQNCIGFNDDLIIPNSVTFIDNQAFTFCTGLSGALIIGNSVTTIGGYAFYECSGLTSVTIGNLVASIGSCAFSGCSNLSTMNVFAETPPSLGSIVFYNVNQSIPVYVPYGTIAAYQAASGWSNFTNYQEMPPVNTTQTIDLVAGWNWFSPNVEITLENLQDALVDALPNANSIMIKSKNGITTYNGDTWRGQLDSLDVTQMYRISVGTDCEIILTGMPINPTEHPITIHNGVNWIGFPLSENMTLSDAFAGFVVAGDIVKSKNGVATFNGTSWRGTLNTLVPSQGYIYKSNVQNNRTFTFPTGAK